jgi:Holliday junction resolvase-like predicted endonuclease
MTDTKYRKKLGAWGEFQLDSWIKEHGWLPVQKNLKIPGGEIDRIYAQNKKQGCFCLAEIKTNVIFSQKIFFETFSEIGIKKYIKQRQIQNLYKLGEHCISKGYAVFLRIFIILKTKCFINKKRLPLEKAIRICYVSKDFWILSVTPEFTNINTRKSLLQIKL